MNLQVSAQIQASSKRYNRLSLCKRNTMDTPAIQKQDLAMPNQMTIAFVLGRLLPRQKFHLFARRATCSPPSPGQGASLSPTCSRWRKRSSSRRKVPYLRIPPKPESIFRNNSYGQNLRATAEVTAFRHGALERSWKLQNTMNRSMH